MLFKGNLKLLFSLDWKSSFLQIPIVWRKRSLDLSFAFHSRTSLYCNNNMSVHKQWLYFNNWVNCPFKYSDGQKHASVCRRGTGGWWQEGEESRRETDRGKQSHHLPVLALLSPLLHCTNYCLPCSPISMQQGSLAAPLAPGHWIRYLCYGVRGSGAVRPITLWIIWDSCSPLTRRRVVKRKKTNKGIRSAQTPT